MPANKIVGMERAIIYSEVKQLYISVLDKADTNQNTLLHFLDPISVVCVHKAMNYEPGATA